MGSTGGISSIAVKVSLGLFWSVYVLSALACCLIFAVLLGKLAAGFMVEKPLYLDVELKFDYTKKSPAAEVAFPGGLIRPGRRLKSTIFLVLPESEYNRRLGVFQVKTEFLAANGRPTATSTRPCMLPFNSPLIQTLKTLLHTPFLLTRRSSESQLITLPMDPFTEPVSHPTSSARVLLSPRAEQPPGSGLPEIYSARMEIKSELSLVRELTWRWRRTLFVITVASAFNIEVLLLLLCCAPFLLPGISRRSRHV